MTEIDNLSLASARVDYRLTYGRTDAPRTCHGGGIDGPEIPNAYHGRLKTVFNDPETLGSGDWADPGHPALDASQPEHIARWFQTAIREAVHEACEWFWVDGSIYLDPHGDNEAVIHSLSERFAEQLLELRDNKED